MRAEPPIRVAVEEPVNNLSQQNGLAVGALIIESPSVDGVSANFCRTAIQIAVDILALAFANARSKFTEEETNAKR